MNRNRLLNAELSHAIASMGHGDLMIICDAGFPIPSSAWRMSARSSSAKAGSSSPRRAARPRKISLFGRASPSGAMAGRLSVA